MTPREAIDIRDLFITVCKNQKIEMTVPLYRKFIKACRPKGVYPIKYWKEKYPRDRWIVDRITEVLENG